MMKKLLSLSLCLIFVFALSACGNNKKVVEELDKKTVSVVEEKETEIVPVVKEQYEIFNALTDFKDDRAWVTYDEGNNSFVYAIIDKYGYEVWSVKSIELNGWKNIAVEQFEEGILCIHSGRTYGTIPGGISAGTVLSSELVQGMIVVDKNGDVKFDSRNAPEGTKYYYRGYGNKTFLCIENIADFSTDIYNFCEMDVDGKITVRTQLEGKPNECWSDYRYIGDGLYMGGGGENINSHGKQVIYNHNNRKFIHFDRFVFKEDFSNGKAIIRGTSWISGEDEGSSYRISLSDLQNQETYDSFYKNIKNHIVSEPIPAICNFSVSEGLAIADKDFRVEANNYKKGVYDKSGNQICTFPDNWNITEKSDFSGGYAALALEGADKEKYIVVIDKNGKQQFEPIKVASYTFPSWHGYVSICTGDAPIIINYKGQKTSLDKIKELNEEYKVGYHTNIIEYKRNKDKNNIRYINYTSNDGKTIDKVTILSNYKEYTEYELSKKENEKR